MRLLRIDEPSVGVPVDEVALPQVVAVDRRDPPAVVALAEHEPERLVGPGDVQLHVRAPRGRDLDLRRAAGGLGGGGDRAARAERQRRPAGFRAEHDAVEVDARVDTERRPQDVLTARERERRR